LKAGTIHLARLDLHKVTISIGCDLQSM